MLAASMIAGTGRLFRKYTIPKVCCSEDPLLGLLLGLEVRVRIAYIRNSGPSE